MGRPLDAARLAGLAAGLGFGMGLPAASAADLIEPPLIEPIRADASWYLRGHIGMSNQFFDGLDHPLYDDTPYLEWINKGDFSAAPIFGLGVGMIHNDHLRLDVVGEYRGKADFSAFDRYSDDPTPDFDGGENWGTNDYTAKKSEFVLMANAYADLGQGWHGIKPYVGAGVGASYNIISGFDDSNVITGGGGTAGTGSMWNLAWALHAGLSFQASENVVVDFGYSFLSLGEGTTDTLVNYDTSCSYCAPVKFKGIGSHDLKLTVRYEFGGGGYGYPEPMYTKY